MLGLTRPGDRQTCYTRQALEIGAASEPLYVGRVTRATQQGRGRVRGAATFLAGAARKSADDLTVESLDELLTDTAKAVAGLRSPGRISGARTRVSM